jgi:hypothetical protein
MNVVMKRLFKEAVTGYLTLLLQHLPAVIMEKDENPY